MIINYDDLILIDVNNEEYEDEKNLNLLNLNVMMMVFRLDSYLLCNLMVIIIMMCLQKMVNSHIILSFLTKFFIIFI